MGLEQIRARLAAFQPHVIDEPKVARAAVALVLAEVDRMSICYSSSAPSATTIRGRATWRCPAAAATRTTPTPWRRRRARRTRRSASTCARAEVIGRLDELRAVARHRPLDLVISPVVFALREPVTLRPSPREVESAIWVPLSFLASPHSDATHDRTLDGVTNQYPAFRYQHYTIWGLTHRILQGFLELVRDDGAGDWVVRRPVAPITSSSSASPSRPATRFSGLRPRIAGYHRVADGPRGSGVGRRR
jgi:hypothetical protein